MGCGRESADMIWYIKKYGVTETLKKKIWKKRYFWKDTVGIRFNRLLGCKLLGHRDIGAVEGDNDINERIPFCFNCYQRINKEKK